MGLMLPKPILSKVIERAGSDFLNVGCASINGFRTSMEDAHMITVPEGDVAYLGIFDGHTNQQCSTYVAQQMPEKLKRLQEPITAQMIEQTCVDIDKAYLGKNVDGGTTATFCIVRRDGRVTIANVGDSRTLVSRGSQLLFATEDHKPHLKEENERIVRCGGSVAGNRVDGDLAVSRAFGDRVFKVDRTRDYRNQKVVCVPDVTEITCQSGDIIILACDGVFEGDFSNTDVVNFVHNQMSKCFGDIAVVACRVCDEAVRRGSRDNISCMIVQLSEGTSKVKAFGVSSFVPGPPYPRNHEACRKAYRHMAEFGGTTPVEALRTRYSLLQAYTANKLDTLEPVMRTAYEMSDDVDVETERAFFGRGPAPGNETAFFEALATNDQ